MLIWLSKVFNKIYKNKTLPTKNKQNQINIFPYLNQLKLLNVIEILNQTGMVKMILNSPTFDRLTDKKTISWDVCCRFLKENDMIDQLEPEEMDTFYKLISTPNLLPVLRELYKESERQTSNLVETRDEKAKGEINTIVSILQEYKFDLLIKRSRMMQSGIRV